MKKETQTITPFINAPTSLEEALSNRAVRDILASHPHPREHMTEQGFTYLDYALWCYQHKYRKASLPFILKTILKMVEKARHEELEEAIIRG